MRVYHCRSPAITPRVQTFHNKKCCRSTTHTNRSTFRLPGDGKRTLFRRHYSLNHREMSELNGEVERKMDNRILAFLAGLCER